MIVVTGAAGFIGSCLVGKLNEEGHDKDVFVVDDFYKSKKDPNLNKKWIRDWIHRDLFLNWFAGNQKTVKFVFHLGARTDTAEKSKNIFNELNLNYSKKIWNICAEKQIPLVYASSAATYGGGEHGYNDAHNIVSKLKPLNAYGDSKNDFDIWALKQKKTPPFWAGMKFFNVYGPNEYHKKRMASVIFHTVKQIKETGKMKLFRSHKKGIKDGHQQRDFIYVKDVLDILYFFYKQTNRTSGKKSKSGLYNVGTGQARTFIDLAKATFHAMDLEPEIGFMDTPVAFRKNYQYFTEANIKKLRAAGYKKKFHSLEEGVDDYVRNYLLGKKIF